MWALVWSPVRFFEQRLDQPPRWRTAIGIPALCGSLDMAAVLLLGAKSHAAIQEALPAAFPAGTLLAAKVSASLSILGFPLYYALAAMIVASADVLCRDSHRQLRLIEFTGLAFGVFLPGCLFLLGIAVFWVPPSAEALSPGVELPVAVGRYLGWLRNDPWLSTAGVLYYFCLAWCAALLGVVLHVVSSFSRLGATAAAAAIFAALSGFWL